MKQIFKNQMLTNVNVDQRVLIYVKSEIFCAETL
ncbi:MAG: hypothetical protein JWR38_2426 [Mucilaginibacter sp.]|nr:hypothetical protein [Mucilaginibacter sp.]